MIAEIACGGLFLIMALLIIVGLPVLERTYDRRLSHIQEMAKIEDSARQAEHRRSLELSEALRDPSPLELEARKEEAKARNTEAQLGLDNRRRNRY